MIQICLLLFVAGLTFGGAGVNWWRETLQKAEESKRVAAEQKLAEETAKAIEEGKNKLIDMQASFEAGQAKAKVIYKTVYEKARGYVQSTPTYSNPVCVVDAAGVHIINSQIAALQRTAAAAALGITLPDSGSDKAADDNGGGAVPAVHGSSGDVPGVSGEGAKSGEPAAVPGKSMQRPSKPKPIN